MTTALKVFSDFSPCTSTVQLTCKIRFISGDDGIYVLGNARIYALHPALRKFLLIRWKKFKYVGLGFTVALSGPLMGDHRALPCYHGQ